MNTTHTQNWNDMYEWLLRKLTLSNVSMDIHTISMTDRMRTMTFIVPCIYSAVFFLTGADGVAGVLIVEIVLTFFRVLTSVSPVCSTVSVGHPDK